MVTLKDQNQATIYSGNSTNGAGLNTLALNLGTFTNPLTLEITNSSNNQTFELDNITLTQDGIAGVSYYTAQLVSAQDYYPFGTTLPGRTFQDDRFSGYRFTFNGKELDKEGMGGGGSTYDYGFRIYNAQLGKFLSVDPLTKSYPWYTPYQFAGNMPISAIDLDGLEELVVIYWYKDGKSTGATFLRIADEKDRVKPTGTMYLKMEDNQENRNIVEDAKSDAYKGVIFDQTKGKNQLKKDALMTEIPRNGLEKANLEEGRRYAGNFRNSIDPKGAAIKFEQGANGLFDKTGNKELIQKMSTILKDNPDYKFTLTGYASAEGDPIKNNELALSRANELKNFLVENGIDAGSLDVQNGGVTGTNDPKSQDESRKVSVSLSPR